TGDTAARLRAWDQTAPLPEADISINTDHMHPTAAAAAIHNQAQCSENPAPETAMEWPNFLASTGKAVIADEPHRTRSFRPR
ncbi:MAG: hypothetical protein ACRDRP_25915, partial [Pseudonocardiaceae bacterium]